MLIFVLTSLIHLFPYISVGVFQGNRTSVCIYIDLLQGIGSDDFPSLKLVGLGTQSGVLKAECILFPETSILAFKTFPLIA